MTIPTTRAQVLRGALCALAIIAVGAPASAVAQPAPNGRNVTSVDAGPSRFVLTPAGWDERSRDGRFSFREEGRDDWSVYLSDASRGVRLQLDLHTRKVMYAEGAGPMSELYAITGASAEVNGRNAIRVTAGQGSFRMTAPGRWTEQGNDGGSFQFSEQNRDDWSVYLSDPSRGVRIQLDLHTRKVMYADAGAPRMRALYDITGASATR